MENLNTRYSTTTTAFLSAVRRHDFHTPQSEILTVFFSGWQYWFRVPKTKIIPYLPPPPVYQFLDPPLYPILIKPWRYNLHD